MRDLEFDINARDRTAAGFNSARGNARAFNAELDSTSLGMKAAGMAASAFAGAFTLTAVSEFGRVVRQTITDAADMVDLADKVGVATGDLQRMTYGFGLAGVAAEDIDQILSQWSKRIGAAYSQGGKLAEIFKANGISLTDSEGRLRSAVDLMRSYADLVANAGSDQERMTLATEAFGKAGGSMVLALRDGAAGMDKLMASADDAGGVLEDEVLRRAADIDDAFGKMWHRFEINSKSAILNTVAALDDFRQSDFFQSFLGAQDYMGRGGREDMGAQLGAMAGRDPVATKGGRLKDPIDQRIGDAHESGEAQTDTALARAMRERYSTRTVIPGGGDGGVGARSRSAAAAREQESAFDRVIDKLREEQDMLGLDETAQRVLSEQRRAGVSAASEQGQSIDALVRKIEGERVAIEKSQRQHEAFERSLTTAFDSAGDAITSIVDGSDKAGTALAKLAVNFALAAAQATLFQSGPLAGLLGGLGTMGTASASGASSDWSLGLDDFRAKGGPVDPWGTYVVGEEGPEILRMNGAGGQVVSNRDAFGNSSAAGPQAGATVNMAFNVRSPDAAGFLKSRGQVEAMLARAVSRAGRRL